MYKLRQIILMAVTISMIFIISADLIFAQEQEKDSMNRWGLGYRYRYVYPDDEDFKNQRGHSNSLNLTYRASKHIVLELEGGHFQLENKKDTTIDVFSIHAALQLVVPFDQIKPNIKPYVVGGAGFQKYDYGNATGEERGDDSSFSFKVGPGVEYFFNENWAMNLEAIYVYGDTGYPSTLDVYCWQFGGGVKYYF